MKCYFCEKEINWDNSYGCKYYFCEKCFTELNKCNKIGLILISEKDKKIYDFFKKALTKKW